MKILEGEFNFTSVQKVGHERMFQLEKFGLSREDYGKI